MADSGNIKVVVRCRPMNSREKARGASYLIEVNGDHQLVLLPPPSDTKDTTQQNAKATVKKAMPFSFDRSYDENTEQKTLFEYVGRDLLQHAFNGFNTCVFAYGQTGSGKSHSMVGYAEAKGLIPLTCSQLFDDIDSKVQADPNLRISVEVSYIEIYNEKVRDLLNPKNKGNLKVREHPSLGPYVEDLSKLVVPNFSELMDLMDEGNKARTVASTNMNETSSRSHAVFTLILSQKRLDVETKLETEKVSRISLVDLAGSERANSTGATGARLKEGANINRSLTTLGKVIAALASASMQPAKSKKKEALENFVPYRDSTLTWLLKDSLGGNSKTAMIAAISPADYEETLSTLRYADQAKKIKNKAVVNEDPNAKLIRELKEELETLRNRVSGGGGLDAGEGTWDPDVPPEKQMVRYKTKTGEIKTVTKAELQDQLEQSEKIMSSLNESWEEKLEKTQEIQREREKALEELGISVDKGNVGVHTPKKLPHLVNLNEDPLMSECLIYQLKDGKTLVGNLETDKEAQIRLSGENILPEHCFFENLDGVVTLNSVIQDSMTMVNGKRVKVGEPRRLRSGYRVILGDFHVFRFNNPEEVRKAREKVKSTLALSTGEDDNETLEGNTDSPRPGSTRPDSPVSEEGEGMDWIHARREAALARLSGKDVDFDKLNENDLDKLFEDISRARIKKSGGNPNSNRPESRMSFFDDGASESAGSNVNRPFSLSAYTDDTSVDPWHGSEPGSIKTNGVSTNSSNISSMSAEAAKETQDLKLKVKEYEEKIMAINLAKQEEVVDYSDEQKRLIRLVLERWRKERNVTMAEKILSNAVLLKEANVLSKQLGKKAVYQFVIIDHTNSLESNPTSSIDVQTIAGLGASELDDDGDFDLNKAIKPFVAVRVLDHSRNSIHIWSVSKLEQRLNKMRNLYTFIDRPEYSRHFDWADPFYESANNEDEASTSKVTPFSFVGSAVVPLKPLARKISAKYQKVEIKSRDTNQVISTCNVEVKFISISASPMGAKQLNGKSKALNGSGTGTPSRNGALSPTGSDSRASSIQEIQSIDLDDDIPSGHKLGIQFCVDSVKGLHAKDFSSVHLQTRLSSFTGPSVTSDDVYLSTPIDINEKQDSGDELKLRKTISFVLNPEISEYIRDGNFIVELFARATSSYLEGLEKFDSEKETGGADKNEPEPSSSSRPSLSHSRTGSSSAISLAPSTSRVSEKEMVSSESHDILVSVSICELNAAGEYEPVQVKATSSLDPGCFFLRQGLQRKIVIKMSHDSGRQFVLKKISKLELGEVRLLDSKGRIHVSTIEDPLVLKTPVKQQSVDFEPNGFSELNLWSWWDSSVHDSIFLNRLTSTSQRVLLKLRIHLDFERGVSPAIFEMDISVSINPRDSKPINKFFSFVENVSNGSTSKILNKSNGVFNVRLIPPLTKKTKELWRLDTGKRYVRGEECIKGWKPRGISLVIDHRKNAEQIRKKTEVEAVKVMLKARPPLSLSNGNGNGHQGNGSDEWENEGERTFRDERVLQNKALELWLRAVRDSKVSVLAEKADEKRALEISSPTTDSMPFSDAPPSPKPLEPLEPVKLTAEVKLVPRSDGAARRGWLAMPIEAFTDSWVKRWFVLQRPYLHVFADKEEIDEVMVMNLASVRLEHDENIEQMLDRNNVFCLYTASNSYFLQSKTPQEMEGWMTSLDASHR